MEQGPLDDKLSVQTVQRPFSYIFMIVGANHVNIHGFFLVSEA